jgi:hypothetical protein
MIYKYIIIALLLSIVVVRTSAQQAPNEEDWSEMPRIVSVESELRIPADALVLFDGSNMDRWQHADGEEATWKVENGVLEIVPGEGNIYTREHFGDCQLHVEWMIPEENYGSGNSGIYLMGRYEVQIFNSYQNSTEIYYNGQTGSLYKQHKPLVNVSRPRGKWESFDIIFNAPLFDSTGELLKPARFTVLQNGVLIQKEATLKGITTHEKFTGYEYHKSKEPLMIQDHGDPVRFRNIWIREL